MNSILPGVDQAVGSLQAPSSETTPETGLQVLDLVRQLCQALADEQIKYCHWKSNNALDRSASGDNDLDLLVSRIDVARFTQLLYQLGFKRAVAAASKELPGVINFYGYDGKADKIIHVHAHYQLVLGHDLTKNIRLPIEDAYIDSSVQQGLFKVPAPEFEFIVFIIRMVLKHCTWDIAFTSGGSLKKSERNELNFLMSQTDKDCLNQILNNHFPYVDVNLFHRCVQSMAPACSAWTRVRVGQQLISALLVNSRHPFVADAFLKKWRWLTQGISRRIWNTSSKPSLENGGVMIAIIGGDGSGKSTVVDALFDMLSKYFPVARFHLGKPSWSRMTVIIRSLLKIGQLLGLYPEEASLEETLEQNSFFSPGYPWMIREVCRARDRYLTYIKARRFSAKGGIVISDRFPTDQLSLMDGPHTERYLCQLSQRSQAKQLLGPHLKSRLAKFLIKREKYYYSRIILPEIMLVMRLDPEIAVMRRPDEDPNVVRRRNQEVYTINWEKSRAYVIDACQPKAKVLSEVKSLVWSKL